MAAKGQKFKKYTIEEKTTALELAKTKGITYASYALKININTIAAWQFKERNKKDYVYKPTIIEKELEKLKQKLKKSEEKLEVFKKFVASIVEK